VNPNEQRYTSVAIVLHWAIAAAILSNLIVGWWMKNAIDETAVQARAIAAFQLHKSIGLTVLLLSALRLVWRLTHEPPRKESLGLARSTSTGIRRPIEACDRWSRKIAAGGTSRYARVAT
jgi:cytochrome b561